jgi:hypothetical protein
MGANSPRGKGSVTLLAKNAYSCKLVAVVVAKIAVAVAVPVMVVFALAAIAVPVAIKEALSVMVRRHPACARINCASPVSGMPLIVSSHWIPVAFHPDEFRAWTSRQNPNHPRGRWRADSNSDRNLAEHGSSNQEQEHQHKQFLFHPFILLV